MSYMDEMGLSRHDPKLKEWIGDQPVKTLPSTLYPWTLTEKSGAVTCWPVGGTPLLPTMDFMFSETGPAEGAKDPDNPSTITGVSEVKVTRCGKNILKTPYYSGSVANSTVTITPATDGTLTITKIASSSNTWYNFNDNNIGTRFSAGTTFILSGTHTGGTITVEGWAIWVFEADGSVLFSQSLSSTPGSFTLDHDAFLVFRLFLNKNHVCSDVVLKPQIEIGSTVTAFEPYDGADYTIDLGSTYYGGSVDLATGLMTVTHCFDNVTFNSIIAINTNTIILYVPTTYNFTGWAVTGCCSNRFVFDATTNDDEHFRGVGPISGSNQFNFYLNKNRLDLSGAVDLSSPTNAEWLVAAKDWLAENPTYVVYPMLTPLTVQLTPTQILSLTQPDKYTPRLNTVYTDASAVQVGYVKSPIREEYELTQAIVAQGGEI